MKARYIIALVIIMGFIIYGAVSLKTSLTPYVSFAEAKSSPQTVQVMGELEKSATRYDTTAGLLYFTLKDKQGDVLEISYKGVRPGNFDQATQIVAIGNYKAQVFEADQLLVKCPSKYQGEEVQSYKAEK
ncbi:MAG: cytochrome c maturation protein CcmE [candidate division Zixibacteria bacterium]|nr:cytochrome c maturation protein CcmE [candidate division Zixibacteria bacterium]MCI0597011.1 cytochrome c maturation protein CcmE [candidate division Zixibacteria bacterium]